MRPHAYDQIIGVGVLWQLMLGKAECFAEHAFCAIAYDCVADASTYGKAESGVSELIWVSMNAQGADIDVDTGVVDCAKLLCVGDTPAAWEGVALLIHALRRCCAQSRLSAFW